MKQGMMWQHENITLHCGDCLPAMRGMKDRAFDLAIVDPPYGENTGSVVGGQTIWDR
jgi:DNA modification methylase